MEKKLVSTYLSRTELIKLFKIFIGNILLGLAYAKWMVPNKIINGGVTSLALVVSKITQLDIVYLTNGITIGLLLICFFFLGKGTLLRSLFSSVCYLSFFSFFSHWDVSLTTVLPLDFALACVVIALGYYCCLSAEASTVGMDIIALIINQKQPKFSVSKCIRYLNYLVLTLGFVTYGWQAILLGLLFSYLYSWILEKLLASDFKIKRV